MSIDLFLYNQYQDDEPSGEPTPQNQLASIDSYLDVLDIPRTYPDSEVPCTTRERVNMLVQYCVARGVKWEYTQEVF